MYTNFTTICNHYYYLIQQLRARYAILKELEDNAPVYSGQLALTEIDAVINYYSHGCMAKEQVDETLAEVKKAENSILAIMRQFEIPPGKVLYGEIPGELEYELWANEQGSLYINKIKTIEPEPEKPNVITIKLNWGKGG
jgi:hypothetical protein